MSERRFKIGDCVDVRCKNNPGRNVDAGIVESYRHDWFIAMNTGKAALMHCYLVRGSDRVDASGNRVWLDESLLIPNNVIDSGFEELKHGLKLFADAVPK